MKCKRKPQPRKPLHYPPHCECGRARKESLYAVPLELNGCRFCNAMDGRRPEQRDVINFLRSVDGGVSIPAVAFELRKTEKAAVRQLIRMRKRGEIGGRPIVGDEPWDRNCEVEYRLASRKAP